MSVNTKYFGRSSYRESLKIQEEFFQEILKNPERVHVLGFEYESVITLGRRANPKEDVLIESPVPIEFVERGGQATLHSPGQIVIYPLCNIRLYCKNSAKLWVDVLLNSTIHALSNTSAFEEPLSKVQSGVHLGPAKVASLGLRIKKNISTFGLAINLRNDPELFKLIRPCGVSQQKVGTVGYEGSLEDFFALWCESFRMVLRDIDKAKGLLQVEDSRF